MITAEAVSPLYVAQQLGHEKVARYRLFAHGCNTHYIFNTVVPYPYLTSVAMHVVQTAVTPGNNRSIISDTNKWDTPTTTTTMLFL